MAVGGRVRPGRTPSVMAHGIPAVYVRRAMEPNVPPPTALGKNGAPRVAGASASPTPASPHSRHEIRRARSPVYRLGRCCRATSITARIAALLIIGYLILVMVTAASIGNLHTGDTDILVQGARQTLRCLGHGKLIGCGHSAGSPLSQVGPFALLQYLPAMALVELGLNNNQVIHALGSINLAALAASLVVVAAVARRMKPAFWGPVLVLALIGSSLTYQATSGFGEMLAAFFALLAVASVFWRRPVLIAVTMMLAATGKETLFPFLLIFGLLVGRRQADRVLPPMHVLLPLLIGIGIGEILNVGFDEFRFAADKNLTYLQPILRTPGLERKLNFLAGIWVSPSNGALWYWPLAVLLIAAVTVLALVRLIRSPGRFDVWLPPLLVVATLVAFSIGLADWYTPFGWISYGPRLMVPLLPAALVVILYTCGPLLADPLRWVLSRISGVAIVALAVVVVGWPQFGAPWSWAPAVTRLITATGGCPSLTKLIVQNGVSRYYHCSEIVMWRIHPIVLKAAAAAGGGDALVARLLLSAASVVLVIDLVRRARAADQTVLPPDMEASRG